MANINLRSYVFIYADTLGSRDEVKAFVDREPSVVTWRHELPNTFFFVSSLGVNELTQRVRAFNDSGRFLLIEYSWENANGWLTHRAWSLLNEQKLPPKPSEE